ncbi:MAG TPA: FAD-dependent monooxygenase [Chloroflexota bacterium]
MRHTQVLIAGGGPVGLSLAVELGLRGVRCIVVQQNEHSSPEPKARTVHNATLELFRRWGRGVPSKLRAAAPLGEDFPTDILYVTRLTGQLITALRSALRFNTQELLSPERALRIPQAFLEPVIRQEAESLAGVTVLLGYRLDEFEQDADGLRGHIVHLASGRREQVSAAYLAGCDGGRSTVRKQLGIQMEGALDIARAIGCVFRAPELWPAISFGRAMHYNVLNDDLPHLVTMGPISLPDTWSYGIMGLRDAVTPESIDAADLLRKLIGRDMPSEILHVGPWTVHNALAERYRDGRVFLLGDAAHLQPPSGGFGMNGGIGDAANFGWKLAAVLQGWGGEALLDSYDLERRQFHKRALQESAQNYEDNDLLRPGLEDPIRGEETRRELGVHIQRTKPKNFQSLGVSLGYRYEDSPINVSDGSPPTPYETTRYLPTARPGHRAPHWPLADGRALMDEFGHGFALLELGNSDPDVSSLRASASQRGIPLRVLRHCEPELRELYGANLMLVRPDLHVAWRSNEPPADPVALWDTVRGVPAYRVSAGRV